MSDKRKQYYYRGQLTDPIPPPAHQHAANLMVGLREEAMAAIRKLSAATDRIVDLERQLAASEAARVRAEADLLEAKADLLCHNCRITGLTKERDEARKERLTAAAALAPYREKREQS
jgi:hypothetical protein